MKRVRSATADTGNARNIRNRFRNVSASIIARVMRYLVIKTTLFCNALFFLHKALTMARGLKLAELPLIHFCIHVCLGSLRTRKNKQFSANKEFHEMTRQRGN